MAAHDDGSAARPIATGRVASVSPDGRRVAVARRVHGRAYPDLRLVSIRGGRSSLLMRSAVFGGSAPALGPAWSPDGRTLIAGNGANGDGYLIHTATRHRRALHLDTFGGASFRPDGKRVALEVDELRSSDLYVRSTAQSRLRRIAAGGSPAWGSRGLAFTTGRGVQLLERIGGRRRQLVARPSTGDVHPVDWSGDGRRLLVAEEVTRAPMRALLVTPATGHVTTLPQSFDEIDGLSRDGRLVLGVVGGDVVAASADGATVVLAAGADSRSWTR